jgi:hypothetical protein
VDVPPGTSFFQLSSWADTQEAYDAFTEQDGWTETVRYDPETGLPGGWKTRPLGDGNVTVFGPTEQP